MAETKLKQQQAFNQSPPSGYMINGKIVPSVSSNNLTIAIKTLAGNDPSDADPVYIRIGSTVRTIRTALSITMNAGTNWLSAGLATTATREIDYFVYLVWNTLTNSVTLAMSRLPYGYIVSDYIGSTTDSRGIIHSASPNSTDELERIGRFAATLSAGAAYTWTVPTFNATNLVQKPINETRNLQWTPIFTGFSVNPAYDTGGAFIWYKIIGNYVTYYFSLGNGTSNSSLFNIELPISSYGGYFGGNPVNNAGVYNLGSLSIGGTVMTIWKDGSLGVGFTASGNKSMQGQMVSPINYPG